MARRDRRPEVRFSGFSDPWEQRKLGDIFNYERPDDYIVESGEYSDRFDTPVLTANKGFILGYTNETRTYTRQSVIFDDFTLACKYTDFPYMVKSSAIKILTVRDEKQDDLRFAFELLNSARIEMMGHARHYISIVQPTDVLVPKIQEQENISQLLSTLDSLIALQQRKVDKLVVVKKAMLEKMFPKDGANVPEIRFAGFTDAWKKQKFGEMAKRDSVMAVCNSDLPGVEYDDIISGQGVLNKNIREKAAIKTGIRFAPDDVLFGKLRPYLRNWLLPDFSGVAIGDFWVLNPFETDSRYLYYLIQTRSFQRSANQSTGTKMPRADWSLVSNTPFSSPKDSAEQNQIGLTLQAVDSLITLQQRKLGKLKHIKDSMLERMFV